MGPRVDLVGQVFGELTVLSYLPSKNQILAARWICRCSCGAMTTVLTKLLNSGATRSCGCLRTTVLQTRNTTHGLSGTPEYVIWSHMIARCENPNTPNFGNYGGRGISVCPKWRHNFPAFLADVGPRPSPAHSLDRTDNDGSYTPENCAWVLPEAQSNNKRTNVFIEWDGRRQTLQQWSSEIGISLSTLHDRLERGWSVHRAFTHSATAYHKNRVR